MRIKRHTYSGWNVGQQAERGDRPANRAGLGIEKGETSSTWGPWWVRMDVCI